MTPFRAKKPHVITYQEFMASKTFVVDTPYISYLGEYVIEFIETENRFIARADGKSRVSPRVSSLEIWLFNTLRSAGVV